MNSEDQDQIKLKTSPFTNLQEWNEYTNVNEIIEQIPLSSWKPLIQKYKSAQYSMMCARSADVDAHVLHRYAGMYYFIFSSFRLLI